MFSGINTERPKAKAVNSMTSKGQSYNASFGANNVASTNAGMTNHKNNVLAKNSKSGMDMDMNAIAGYGAAAAGLGNALLGDDDLVHEGQLESTTRAVDTINSTKDAIGQVIPIAGMFREVEKLGVKMGQAIDGDKGQAIAEGYLSPIQTVGKLNADDEISQGNKMLGSVATLALPFGGTISGNMIHRANQKRVKRKAELDKYKKATREEIEYQNQKEAKAIERLKGLREAQLNYVPTTRYS